MYAGVLSVFGTPLKADIESVLQNLQMQVIEVRRNDMSKSKFDADNLFLIELYKKYLLPRGKFFNLVEHAKRIPSVIGCKYVFKQLFSRIKDIKYQLMLLTERAA